MLDVFWLASQLDTWKPSVPMPPVSTTELSMDTSCLCDREDALTTIFPTCLAWDICLSADETLARLCVANGSGLKSPLAAPADTLMSAACRASSGMKSTASREKSTSGRSCAARAALHMSLLLISTKRPPWPMAARDPATMPLDVKLFRTTWTGSHSAMSDANMESLEPKASKTPRLLTRDRLLELPAVAMVLAPLAVAIWMAARPTPPAAACMRRVSPGWMSAILFSAVSTVMKTVGMVAASWKDMPSGIGTSVLSEATTWLPKLPAATPKTLWPTVSMPPFSGTLVTMPEQSPPGSPGSPGYMPSTLSTSLKLIPTAWTWISTFPASIESCSSASGTKFPNAPRGRGIRW